MVGFRKSGHIYGEGIGNGRNVFTGVISSKCSSPQYSTVSTVMKMATVLQKSLPSNDNIKRHSQREIYYPNPVKIRLWLRPTEVDMVTFTTSEEYSTGPIQLPHESDAT